MEVIQKTVFHKFMNTLSAIFYQTVNAIDYNYFFFVLNTPNFHIILHKFRLKLSFSCMGPDTINVFY